MLRGTEGKAAGKLIEFMLITCVNYIQSDLFNFMRCICLTQVFLDPNLPQ